MSKLSALHLTKHTGPKHTATVIFFHGSGDTGDNIKEWVSILMKRFEFPHIKVLFPTAPLQPYTPAGGANSTVWFDRSYISPKVPEKLDSLENAEKIVKDLLQKEYDAGIPSKRIVVGGFSMGGALALHTAYRWDKNIAGTFAFSSFLNDNSVVYKELKESPGGPPLLQIHGDKDALVSLEWAKTTHQNLLSLGVQGEMHVVPKLGHTLNKSGVQLIKNFIEKVLPEDE